MLKELVKERLMAAADEILALVERTIASYEEELSRTREEKELHRQKQGAVSKTHIVLHIEDVQQLIGRQEEPLPQPQVRSSTFKQGEPQPPHIKEEEYPQAPHIKEEEEELSTTQEGECLPGPDEAHLTKLPPTGVSVKTEEHEHKPSDSSQLHHNPNEENRGAEPPRSSSSPQHMATEADGDHCGGSQADKLLDPLSDNDNTTSHSPEDGDWDHTQEALSSDTDCEGDMRTQTDNKHSECSKKKTGKKRLACSERFSLKCNLTQQMLTHTGEKPFTCSVCDNTFTQRSTLKQHMTIHTGEKPFSCSVCDKRFSRKSNMESHMATHTREKPYSCSVCGDKFSLRYYLKRHMKSHTGEKPYSCSVCGDKFTLRYYLKRHTKTHTGEKPFSCSVCGNKFSLKSSMTRHMTAHTGEKPFSCSMCGQEFTRKDSMVHHVRRHRGKRACREGLESASDKKRPVTITNFAGR
ncbi:zinc finger and SCAN domain-containing protein 2-like [Dunckerocampus dactyliophorus]|uniref:zinc finger and SCAN domain-containing protein 2-like n=1 Tax=Dunckerocampus dactyliophorus TaxID=161453 RepID=UPI00240498F4|nr:zinc finger and SCAN domain-containing protein 2-like [Dunckerocampus dactyliophorus]